MDRGQLLRGLWKNQTAGISDHRKIIEIIFLEVLSPKRSSILLPILFNLVIKSKTNTCKSKKSTRDYQSSTSEMCQIYYSTCLASLKFLKNLIVTYFK